MVRKQTHVLVVFLLLVFSVGSVLGADLITKRPLKITGDEIPAVVSSREVLKSANRIFQSPGTILDSTYYDWQRNGGLDDHLAFFDDGGAVKINGTMMVAYQTSTVDRTMNYYFWDGTSWSGVNDPVFPARNGFGSMSQFSNGSVVVSTHLDDPTTKAYDSRDAAPGSRIFSYCDSDTVPGGSNQIWPRITTTSNGSVIMTGTNQNFVNGIKNHASWAKAPSIDDCYGPWNLIGDISPDWMDDDMEWPTIAAGINGRVGIVIPDVAGAIRYYSSTDNGSNFTENVIATADTAGLPADLDSTAARLGWINSDIMFIGEEAHVVWTAGQGLNTGGGTYGVTDFKTTIYHWSQTTGTDEVVVAWTQGADSSRADFVPTPWNHLGVDWPSIGMSTDGDHLVVAFTGFNTDDIDPNSLNSDGTPGVGYCDIFLAASPDNGETWSPPIPVTNPDGTNLGWDDRYPSIAKVNMDNDADPGKEVYMIYQTDDLGGTFVQGTEAAINMDYVKFLGVDLDLVLYYPEPGISGQVNDFTISGADPGDVIYIVWGLQPGSTTVPACPGQTVGINNPNIAGTAVADVNGIATFSTFIPPPASNLTILVQAVKWAPGACEISNLLRYRFQSP